MSGFTVSGADTSPKQELSRERFVRLFGEVSSKLRCIALAIVGDRTQADDLVQEAAVIALGKLDEFTPGTSFGAWMGQIVRYAALNERRRRMRRDTTPVDPNDMDSHKGATEQRFELPIDGKGALQADQSAFDDDVVRALNSLDQIPRACILLRTTMALGYKEIAELLDIPEGTAMSHVHRARRKLREALGGTEHASGHQGVVDE